MAAEKEAPREKSPAFLEKLKGIEMPHPLIIIFAIVIMAALATWVIPGGQYRRIEVDGRMVVESKDSFSFVPHKPQGIIEIVLVPFSGMMQASEIIMLLFIIGGAFCIIKDTGALSAGIYKVTQLLKGREAVMIPTIMLVFGLGGGIFGMYEEVLPFVGLVVPMAVAMGYDSIVGVAMVYLATVMGFCGAFFNPFTVGIAQGVAKLPLFSGVEYRLVVWSVMMTAAIVYVLIYAAKVKKNPQMSETFESDKKIRETILQSASGEGFTLTRRHYAVLVLLFIGFALLPVGVIKYKWAIKELTGLFFTLGILSGLLGGLGLNKTTESFIEGARDMVTAALLIGIARGIKILLEDGMVMDTLLFYMSSLISHFPKLIAVQIMFFVQCFMNLFIQSGSAQAAVSMPIMAPLADLLGITRQTAVLAFQLGDGFTNFAIPWNGITLAVLNIGLVPMWAWFRWAWKLQAWLVIICMLLLVWPTLANWGPF
ncbi:MAG: hypothetical protein RDV48_12355 [Candidatus Eremiobacteraeota bacterium]|nr:hypothetical protein [Candidatus Eremiobacteraeota bacterium]